MHIYIYIYRRLRAWGSSRARKRRTARSGEYSQSTLPTVFEIRQNEKAGFRKGGKKDTYLVILILNRWTLEFHTSPFSTPPSHSGERFLPTFRKGGVQWKQGVVVYIIITGCFIIFNTTLHPPPTAPPCNEYPDEHIYIYIYIY